MDFVGQQMAGTQPHKEQSRVSRQLELWEKRGHSPYLRNKKEGVEASTCEEVRPSRAPQTDVIQTPRNLRCVALGIPFYCSCPGLGG